MNVEPIIKSLLDTDWYKFTMLQAMLKIMEGVEVEYEFKCRSETSIPLSTLALGVEEQLEHLECLRFTTEELQWLSERPGVKNPFVEFLSTLKMKRKYVNVKAEGDNLRISIKGPLVETTLFEIYLLKIVNKLYFDQYKVEGEEEILNWKLLGKLSTLADYQASKKFPLIWSDFGNRRARSPQHHAHVLTTIANHKGLKANPNVRFAGCSNVYYAKHFGWEPQGTIAHEWFMLWQVLATILRTFQSSALYSWYYVNDGNFNVALTDTINLNVFLSDFNPELVGMYKATRQDSGNPFVEGDKTIAHYGRLDVDSGTKTIVFSDRLGVKLMLELYEAFADAIQVHFGIGTNLTNDGIVKPLDIVIKLVRVSGKPVVKVSNSPGKTMCEDAAYVARVKELFGIK